MQNDQSLTELHNPRSPSSSKQSIILQSVPASAPKVGDRFCWYVLLNAARRIDLDLEKVWREMDRPRLSAAPEAAGGRCSWSV